jgi:hypothetical protein
MKKIIVICIVLFVVVIAGVAAVVLPIVAKTKEAALKIAAEKNAPMADETEKTPAAPIPAQNEIPEPSPTKTDSPTLVDAIRGKRVHFEISGPDKKKYQVWFQIAEGDQLATGVGTRHQTITFHSKGYSLFTVAPSDGDTVELRFTKGKLSPGDPFQQVEHTHGVDLATVLASTDNSTDKHSVPGVILKIEDAQPLEKQPAEKNSPN